MEKSRNKIEENKKRIERHKNIIEMSDISKEKKINKTTKEMAGVKKKKIIKKKPSKEHMAEIKKRAEERAYKKLSGIDEDIDSDKGSSFKKDEEVSSSEITKEERAERFKKLHELATLMTNKWKEENKK